MDAGLKPPILLVAPYGPLSSKTFQGDYVHFIDK